MISEDRGDGMTLVRSLNKKQNQQKVKTIL